MQYKISSPVVLSFDVLNFHSKLELIMCIMNSDLLLYIVMVVKAHLLSEKFFLEIRRQS